MRVKAFSGAVRVIAGSCPPTAGRGALSGLSTACRLPLQPHKNSNEPRITAAKNGLNNLLFFIANTKVLRQSGVKITFEIAREKFLLPYLPQPELTVLKKLRQFHISSLWFRFSFVPCFHRHVNNLLPSARKHDTKANQNKFKLFQLRE